MTWNIFRFSDEIELLKLRIAILSPVVDRFIAIQSTHTFRGRLKPLALDRYIAESISPKLEAVTIARSSVGDLDSVEAYGWNAAYPSFYEIKPTDTVLITDLDEIPRPEVVSSYNHWGIVGLQMTHYHYWLNWKGINQKRWRNSTMKLCTGAELQHRTPHGIRWLDTGPGISNAGWHFSYMGGPCSVIQKCKSMMEEEKEWLAPEEVEKRMNSGFDVLDESMGIQFEQCRLYELPKYVQENSNELRAKGLLK